jgi:hypothetical protein
MERVELRTWERRVTTITTCVYQKVDHISKMDVVLGQ